MPRLVRRKARLDRIKDYLSLGDWLLWLSEEFETREWDTKQYATPLAIGLHIIFLIAKANTGTSGNYDDVFGEEESGSGWLGWITWIIVWGLGGFSVLNACWTFARKRHYRLFESSIEKPHATPSARRVRVDSSPVSSSPLRYFSDIMGSSSAESRAHPDPTRDVWEIAVWDPTPACLRLFCLFSPGHVLVYSLFLPASASDPHPNITVFTTIILQVVLSVQALALQAAFSQQEKDTTIIHKEVMNEYDIKYVHPRLNPLVRDVATQYSHSGTDMSGEDESSEVDTYTPTVILKRGFRTNPNPNYAKHVDPDNTSGIGPRTYSPSPAYTPSAYNSREPTPFSAMTPRPPIRQPQFLQSHNGVLPPNQSTGDGGSLGVYSHANSPLKKATSMYDMQPNIRDPPRNSHDMASREIAEQRERSASPNKRRSDGVRLPGGHLRRIQNLDGDRRTSAPNALGPNQRSSGFESPYKRGPSRF